MAVTSYAPKNGYRPRPMHPCTNQQPYNPYHAPPTFQQPLPQLYPMSNQRLAAMAGYTDPDLVRWTHTHVHRCRYKHFLSHWCHWCSVQQMASLPGFMNGFPGGPSFKISPSYRHRYYTPHSLSFSFWRDVSLLLPSYHSRSIYLSLSLSPFLFFLMMEPWL